MRARVRALVSSWTLVTSSFSHAEPGHAFFNGLTFWFLAPTALSVLGNAQFLVLYLGSTSPKIKKKKKVKPHFHFSGGAFASLASLAWNKQRNYHSHGASGARRFLNPPSMNLLTDWPTHTGPSLSRRPGAGAIYGLASFFAFAAPNARFLLFFVVPMPAWACIGAIACFDVYNAFTRRVRHSSLSSRNYSSTIYR